MPAPRLSGLLSAKSSATSRPTLGPWCPRGLAPLSRPPRRPLGTCAGGSTPKRAATHLRNPS
eukprot:1409417-Alexandrium_andersonii.AAC.1